MASPITCSFVNITSSTSKEERIQNRYLVRSRTVKNNRRKQLLRTSREQEEYSTRKAACPRRTLLPASTSADQVPETELENDRRSAFGTAIETANYEERQEDQASQICQTENATPIPLSPPISPFFGALATEIFDSSSYSIASEVSVQVFTHLLPRIFAPAEIANYYRAFCTHPLIFYSYAHLHLFVHSYVHPLTIPAQARKCAFSIKISSILQQMLPTLRDAEDIEHVLMAMTLMAKHRDEPDIVAMRRPQTLFMPYALYDDLLDAFQAGDVSGFIPAVRTLVARIGGLHKLSTPGLARMIRMNGLIQASNQCEAPHFDNCWKTHLLLKRQGPVWDHASFRAFCSLYFPHNRSDSDTMSPGATFHLLPMPPSLLAPCINLAIADTLLSLPRPADISIKEFQLLTSARASVQHQLLALPSWDDEPGLGCGWLYEVVRNAALIYCNGVVRPVLPGSLGMRVPLGRLRALLEEVVVVEKLLGRWRDVVLWACVVGALGAHGTEDWLFFVGLLRRIVETLEFAGVADIAGVLSGFVWSDTVGRRGLATVWQAMYGY